MKFSEITLKWQKLSKRLMFIGFTLAAVVFIIMFIVLGVSLNNKSISPTAATVVACVVATVVVTALFIMCFLINKINLKRQEEAKASAEEAHREKNNFLTNMSHDMRTRLNAIMGMTSIAVTNIDNAEKVEDCLKKISLSSRHLLELINEVLNSSQAGNGDEPSESYEAEKSKQADLKGKRLLVAEDNDLNWEIAELLLTSEGFVVEHAENGQTCVDMLLAHKPGYYDAILMDVRMPVMSGLEATTVIRGLRKGYNKTPIIAMTADAFAEDMQKCLECGMNAHIAKPIDIDVVKATLAKYIIDKN